MRHSISKLLLPANLLCQRAKSALADPVDEEARITAYYRDATDGYRAWSAGFNMHFGYYEWGINPFNLEAMLEHTNHQVYKQLGLQGAGNRLLDMGCGLGATCRHFAKQTQVAAVEGITLAPNQVQEAYELCRTDASAHKLRFSRANYHHTPFAAASFDGIVAIESACHAKEANKQRLLSEAWRLLKPGGRLVLCDGFIKQQGMPNAWTKTCYRNTCRHWSLGSFANLQSLVNAAEAIGFTAIDLRDISWRVLPSALYIPWMVIKYGVKLLLQRDKNPQHWHHLLAPVWGAGLACNRNYFGYYLVSLQKPEQPVV